MIKNVKELCDDVLENVDGGALNEDATDSVDYFVYLNKRAGHTLDQLKAEQTEQYHGNPRLFSTDGSEEDLQELIRIDECAWEGTMYTKSDHGIMVRKKEL